MFLIRSVFWLTTVILILPPTPDGGAPAPRVSLLSAALAARVLLEDLSGLCERNPQACATSRETLTLLRMKIETGADIVAAGIAAGRSADHGTLTPADLEPAWAAEGPPLPSG